MVGEGSEGTPHFVGSEAIAGGWCKSRSLWRLVKPCSGGSFVAMLGEDGGGGFGLMGGGGALLGLAADEVGVAPVDRGRNGALVCATPPSEQWHRSRRGTRRSSRP